MERLKSSARFPICICGDAHAPPVGGKSLAQRRWKSIDFQEQRADPNLAQKMEEKMARSKHADKGVAMLMYDISWLLHGILYRNYPELPVTAGVGLGFWVVPSSHMLKTESLCHLCGKGLSGAAIRDIGYQLDSQWDSSHPTFNLSLIV